MRTIAIFNLKGGVGKTITTATMAYCLATRHRKRVLVIDGDSQGNLSQYFQVKALEGESLVDLLEGNCEPYWGDFVTETLHHRIRIIPSDGRMMDADVTSVAQGRCNPRAIEELREAIAEDNGMDYILIDCAPAFNASGVAALRAADDVIIPVRLDTFSTEGALSLMRQIDNMHRANDRLRVAGLLITQWRNTELEQGMRQYLEEHGFPIFSRPIRMSGPVPYAISRRENLLTYSPSCAASVDYKRVVEEYLQDLRGGAVDAEDA